MGRDRSVRAAPGPGNRRKPQGIAGRPPPGRGRKGGRGRAAVVSGKDVTPGAGPPGPGDVCTHQPGGWDVGCTPKRGLSPLPGVPGALWEPPAELCVGAHAAPKAEVMAKLVPVLPAPADTVWG